MTKISMFLLFKLFISISGFSAKVTCAMCIKDYGIKGTELNRAVTSLHGWLLEITLTVPLMGPFIIIKEG